MTVDVSTVENAPAAEEAAPSRKLGTTSDGQECVLERYRTPAGEYWVPDQLVFRVRGNDYARWRRLEKIREKIERGVMWSAFGFSTLLIALLGAGVVGISLLVGHLFIVALLLLALIGFLLLKEETAEKTLERVIAPLRAHLQRVRSPQETLLNRYPSPPPVHQTGLEHRHRYLLLPEGAKSANLRQR